MPATQIAHGLAAIRTLFLAVTGLILSGCSPATSNDSVAPELSYPYRVTTTVGMIADIVARIAGDHAEVDGIIGQGVDPHLYKPTTSDVKKLQVAAVVFYNGLMLEGKMGDVLVKVARSGKPVHAVTETILERGDYVLTNEAAHYDPHIWMDVVGWNLAVEVVAEALAEFDPTNAKAYQSNAENLTARLTALNDYASQAISSIPEHQRVLVTAHDAFSYMARAYGLEVRSIQGLSTESEAGVRDIEDLVTFLVEKSIPAIFVESSVSDKNVRALIEGARARGHDIRIGGELFSDAMGAVGTYEGTYVGMIDHNVTTITRALGGEAPKGGMQGKLGHVDKFPN